MLSSRGHTFCVLDGLEVVFHLLSGGEAGGQQTSMELFQSFREKTVRPWNFRV